MYYYYDYYIRNKITLLLCMHINLTPVEYWSLKDIALMRLICLLYITNYPMNLHVVHLTFGFSATYTDYNQMKH